MNYIGSKKKLSTFIASTIEQVAGDTQMLTYAELFAGTGIVARTLKSRFKKLIVNDVEYYSYVLNQNYIANTEPLEAAVFFRQLNELEGEAGFIFRHYCKGGNGERQYFSDENGKKTDAIRRRIEEWRRAGSISEALYFHLLCALLEQVDLLANTASVYGAYLKHLKKSAQKPLHVRAAPFEITAPQRNEVKQSDANVLINDIEGDVLYLDPPYNSRQYGANYHLLNTIAQYEPFEPTGKTGLRPNYYRSAYCKRNEAATALEYLLQQARFRYIFLSYNNEGILSLEQVRQLLQKYGKYDLMQQPYQRFKADTDHQRRHKATATIEYLHILEKT